MTTLKILERQLMQRAMAPASASPSMDPSWQDLQKFLDGKIAVAVKNAEQKLLIEVERLSQQLGLTQGRIQQLQHEHQLGLELARERAQQEIRNHQTTHEAAMQAHKSQMAQSAQALERRLAQEHSAAVQATQAELARECKARIQAEARLTAMQETNAALIKTMREIKPSTTRTVVEAPVEARPPGWALEVQRRGDGLIYGVIAKPLA